MFALALVKSLLFSSLAFAPTLIQSAHARSVVTAASQAPPPAPITVPLYPRQDLSEVVSVSQDEDVENVSVAGVRLPLRLANFDRLAIIKARLAARYSVVDGDQAPTYPEKARSRRSGKKRQIENQHVSKSSLYDYISSNEDIDFMGQVHVGTPSKIYNLIFDTGSADMWLQTQSADGSCKNCSQSATYDPSLSSSALNLNKDFDIQYGIGSTSGKVYKDTVTIGQLTFPNQTFAAATQMSQEWTGNPASGLLGLGFPTNAKSGATPWFLNLVKDRRVPEGKFSFAFGRSQDGTQDSASSVTFGGIDASKYSGDITYVPIADPRWYFELEVSDITTAGSVKAINNTKHAIIDTGSTLIAGPRSDVAKFWAGIPNSSYVSSGGYYTYPCNQALDVSVTFLRDASGRAFKVNEDDLNFGLVNAFSDRCVGAVIEGNTAGYWILGLTFLKSWYSIYDTDNYQIGFATPTY